MATAKPKETDLYLPVKRLFENQGYEVKSEIGAADVMAVRADETPVIVELKTAFSLTLFHQGIERQAITDFVYIAVPRNTGKPFLRALKNNKSLCRRLGLGLITVRIKDSFTEIHLDPAPYKPRQSKVKQQRLLREFAKRVGDPNKGGSNKTTLMTAYRQDALKCLLHLSKEGATKAAFVAKAVDVDRARNIMAHNHYGWFERVGKGIYDITPKGSVAIKDYASEIKKLKKTILPQQTEQEVKNA